MTVSRTDPKDSGPERLGERTWGNGPETVRHQEGASHTAHKETAPTYFLNSNLGRSASTLGDLG